MHGSQHSIDHKSGCDKTTGSTSKNGNFADLSMMEYDAMRPSSCIFDSQAIAGSGGFRGAPNRRMTHERSHLPR